MIQLPVFFEDAELNNKVSKHINNTLRAIVLCQMELLQGPKSAFSDIPSLAEQKRIVARLEELLPLCARLK